MITRFPSDDYETPIEEFPGYLGMEWDREYCPGPEMQELDEALWREYGGELMDKNISRELQLHLPTGAIVVRVDPDDCLAHLLDQLSAFTVYEDRGPSDAGPASGMGYIYTLAKSATMADVHFSVKTLARAIRTDLAAVRTLSPSTPL